MGQSRSLTHFLGSIIFLIIGVMFLTGHSLHSLRCTRTEPPTNQGTCQLVHRGLLGQEAQSFPLDTLLGARVDEDRNTDGDFSYRVMILTSSGNLPLTSGFSAGFISKQSKVDRINQFIRQKDIATLSLRQDDRGLRYLLGAVFTLWGGGVLTDHLRYHLRIRLRRRSVRR